MLVRPLTRVLTRPLTRGLSRITSRFFTEFLTSVNSHATFTNTITLSGDFEIEIQFSTTDVSGFPSLFSGVTDGDEAWGYIDISAEKVVIRLGGTSFTSSAPGTPNDGKINTAVFKRVSGNVTVSLNGNVGAAGFYLPDVSIVEIARRTTFGYFNGFIANLKIWTGGDRNTGISLGFWSMDDAPTSSIFRDASGNGNDLIKQNIASGQTELLDLYTDVSPNEWRNKDNTVIIPIAGT